MPEINAQGKFAQIPEFKDGNIADTIIEPIDRDTLLQIKELVVSTPDAESLPDRIVISTIPGEGRTKLKPFLLGIGSGIFYSPENGSWSRHDEKHRIAIEAGDPVLAKACALVAKKGSRELEAGQLDLAERAANIIDGVLFPETQAIAALDLVSYLDNKNNV